jgi:hypothetical protein
LSILKRIESKDRQQHAFIEPSDECWVIAEYRPGSSSDEVNRLILNWKCSPAITRLNPRSRRAKEAAIRTVASILRGCCDRPWAEDATWCPIPSSSAIDSASYDDRLWRTVRRAFEGYDLDIRMLLRQIVSTRADHTAIRRLSIDRLYNLLSIDVDALKERPLRRRIILFDDLLTSGKHFKCCQRRLHEAAQEVPVCGLFFAHRIQSVRWRGVPIL